MHLVAVDFGLIAAAGGGAVAHRDATRSGCARSVNAATFRALAAARAPALAFGLFFAPPVPDAIDTIAATVASPVAASIGNLGVISRAQGQPTALAPSQSDALNTYNNAVNQFRAILSQRRAQINSKQQLPDLPGQALYLARNTMISAYKDLTDALPSRIGRPNKFGIPPAYFDAANEPLLDEYARSLQASCRRRPPMRRTRILHFNDVVDLGTAIGRARGLDAATC